MWNVKWPHFKRLHWIAIVVVDSTSNFTSVLTFLSLFDFFNFYFFSSSLKLSLCIWTRDAAHYRLKVEVFFSSSFTSLCESATTMVGVGSLLKSENSGDDIIVPSLRGPHMKVKRFPRYRARLWHNSQAQSSDRLLSSVRTRFFAVAIFICFSRGRFPMNSTHNSNSLLGKNETITRRSHVIFLWHI